MISKFQTEAAFQVAEVYAFRGEAKQAFDWLERAYSVHDPDITEMKGDPRLKRLKADPRYIALLTKMRLPVT